jgi:dipeptidase
VAIRNNLYDPTIGEGLDFLKCFGLPRIHPTYVNRRRWRVFDLVAPSLKIPSETDSFANNYPFSVKADKPVSPADLMRIQVNRYTYRVIYVAFM